MQWNIVVSIGEIKCLLNEQETQKEPDVSVKFIHMLKKTLNFSVEN